LRQKSSVNEIQRDQSCGMHVHFVWDNKLMNWLCNGNIKNQSNSRLYRVLCNWYCKQIVQLISSGKIHAADLNSVFRIEICWVF